MARRVLVTGGAGFIGSHIVEAYLAAGWDVTALDDLSRGKASQVPAGVPLITTDIRSDLARATIATGGFEVLNHHAAQIDVRYSVESPSGDADVNIGGFVNLLEGAGKGGVRRVVFASSGGVVYGNPDAIPTPEAAPKQPISPYGVSKLAGEHYLRALGDLFGFEGVSLRYANVCGPRQDPKSEAGVVSIFVSRLLAGKPLAIFGDGTQTRDYVSVKDVARASVLASDATLGAGDDHDTRAFNIATGVERSVLELAAAAGRVTGRTPELRMEAARPGEILRSALDPGKAARVLGWRPEVSFDDGLVALMEWFHTEG